MRYLLLVALLAVFHPPLISSALNQQQKLKELQARIQIINHMLARECSTLPKVKNVPGNTLTSEREKYEKMVYTLEECRRKNAGEFL